MRALVTGASSGIGRDMTRYLVSLGYEVYAVARNIEKLEELQNELGDHCYVIHGDVTNSEVVNQCVDFAYEKMNGLTGAINCAGSSIPNGILQMTDAEFDWTLKLCLYGTFYVTRAVGKYLQDKVGSIVNMSSLNSTIPNAGAVAYCSAKAGVDMLTKTAAFELGGYGIRVNAIRPGFTKTEAHAPLFTVDGYEDLVLKNIPLKKYGQPDDIASYAIFLLSDASSQITGTNTLIDGGMEFTSYPDITPVMEELMKRYQ